MAYWLCHSQLSPPNMDFAMCNTGFLSCIWMFPTQMASALAIGLNPTAAGKQSACKEKLS